jgi:hypothetical protein
MHYQWLTFRFCQARDKERALQTFDIAWQAGEILPIGVTLNRISAFGEGVWVTLNRISA